MMVAQLYEHAKYQRLAHFKCMNCMVCGLYLNNAIMRTNLRGWQISQQLRYSTQCLKDQN